MRRDLHIKAARQASWRMLLLLVTSKPQAAPYIINFVALFGVLLNL